MLPVAVLAVLAVAIGLWTSRSTSHAGPPVCSTTASATETSAIAYTLTPAQAANAATIAGVARRDGLPDHAVTIALATALQESKLENLSGGDRDSVGLFQQRPSQGWGTPAQLRDPIYAAQAFYHRLTSVTGWRTAAVTTAAQAVQRSAAPYAYADWEPEARALARAFTGQAVAGLTCLSLPRGPAGSSVAALARTELGRSITARPATVAQGWGDASWLVAHAQQLGLAQVGYRGEQWTRARGTWAGAAGAGSLLSFRTG